MNIILNGKKEAKSLTKLLNNKITKPLTLAVILVGNDSSSKVYVNIKEKKAKELGVNFRKYKLLASVSEKKIIELISKLNKDKKVNGIMVQLPLPKKFNTNKILESIDEKKDVDGLKEDSKFIPPTMQAILHLIKTSKKDLENKNGIVLCNSEEFGEPLAKLIIKKFKLKSVEIEHKNNIKDLKKFDVIIVAKGKKNFIKPGMIKKNAVIIDVGINKNIKTGKICGDVSQKCFEKSKYISPVPGGVGPLTVVFLYRNLLKIVK